MRNMKRLIYILLSFSFIFTCHNHAQNLRFGVKGGVLGNKASIESLRDKFHGETMTGFQVGPMIEYRTGFYGLTFDCSLLYGQRGTKIAHDDRDRIAEIKAHSIDIPIEMKWQLDLSPQFDIFFGVGPTFSFMIDKDNWDRMFTHIMIDVLDRNLLSMGWNSTQVGLNLGGGVKILNHVLLSCYYNIGLTNSAKCHFNGNKHDIVDDIYDHNIFESKNKYWQVSLSYLF